MVNPNVVVPCGWMVVTKVDPAQEAKKAPSNTSATNKAAASPSKAETPTPEKPVEQVVPSVAQSATSSIPQPSVNPDTMPKTAKTSAVSRIPSYSRYAAHAKPSCY